MKTCSKCKVEKELDQFEKYYHSTQKAERIRGYCKSCFRLQKKLYKESIKNKKIIQPVVPESIEIVYDTNTHKQCVDCLEWKEIDTNFYRNSKKASSKRCKKCQNEIDKKKYYDKIDQKSGHDLCPQKPGVYADHYQQEQTEEFLTLLGWKKSENNTWFKEGWKTPEGEWLKYNSRRRKRGTKPRTDKGTFRGLRVPAEIQKGIIEMYINNHKQIDIIKQYHVCKQTIRKVILKYLSQSK